MWHLLVGHDLEIDLNCLLRVHSVHTASNQRRIQYARRCWLNMAWPNCKKLLGLCPLCCHAVNLFKCECEVGPSGFGLYCPMKRLNLRPTQNASQCCGSRLQFCLIKLVN